MIENGLFFICTFCFRIEQHASPFPDIYRLDLFGSGDETACCRQACLIKRDVVNIYIYLLIRVVWYFQEALKKKQQPPTTTPSPVSTPFVPATAPTPLAAAAPTVPSLPASPHAHTDVSTHLYICTGS